MVAFLMSILITIAMVAPIFPYAKKRPVGTPLTWGEAMLAGTYIFFIIFWIYGVVPHQWLTLADAELGWRPDLIWLGPGGSATLPFVGWTIETPWFPIMINARAVRDIVAVLLYVGFLGGQMWIWAWWQNRGKRADATKAIEPVSTYGRPLVKQA
ncbi:MAG: hypothetical protein F2694_08275 [Actinobacteria bacterium]|uniref:Unannotated protein n=1 Tax=freshwater metagenome TaxID=449393 RepID=A0A6J6TT96_9ZZZZ|nr:hypothetical protein [Actinomycetota bacterium]